MLLATLAAGFDPQQSPTTGRPGAAPGQQAASHLDGTWTVLFCEKDGQKLSTGQNDTATIQGNMITFRREGKEHRVHLNFGQNHSLTAWPEPSDNANKGETNTGAKTGSANRQGQPAASPQGNAGQTAGQAAGGQKTGEQHPGNTAQANKPNPAHAPQAAASVHQAPPAGAMHHGVYIYADEFLCLALDQGFMDEKRTQPTAGTQHQQPTAGTQHQQPTTPANPNQTTAQPGAAPKPGTDQAAGGKPQTAPGAQAAGDRPGLGETPDRLRQANYQPPAAITQAANTQPAAGQTAGGQMQQQHGFVVILQRAKGGQQQQR